MDSSSFTFAHLMCAKFCHDLAAPLSAAKMGLEMLQESPTDQTISGLIQESTESAIARLNIFRCLTGYTSTPEKPTAEDLHKALTDYLDKKIHLQWNLQNSGLPSGNPARLLLALILTASETLIRGGTVLVSPNFKITATSQSTPLMIRDDLVDLFNKRTPLTQQSPRTIIPYFAIVLAEQLGGKLQLSTPTEFELHLEAVGSGN